MSSCTIEIRLKPRASCDRIAVAEGGTVQVSVTSPAVDNRANEHCIVLIAKKLALPKSALCIIKGNHSRNKVISCEGVTPEDVMCLLGV